MLSLTRLKVYSHASRFSMRSITAEGSFSDLLLLKLLCFPSLPLQLYKKSTQAQCSSKVFS